MRHHGIIAVPMDYRVLFRFVSGPKRTALSDGLLIDVTATVNVPFTILVLAVFFERLVFAVLLERFLLRLNAFSCSKSQPAEGRDLLPLQLPLFLIYF